MKKLAIITTHPIQYNAPVFKMISERNIIRIKVFYTWENSKDGIFDKKFGKTIKWDIPLLDGYNYQFVKNISEDQGTHHFKGMINPDLNYEIEKWKADAILVYGWSFHSHFKAMRHFKGKIPVFFRGDSHLLDEMKNYKALLRKLWLKFVYRYVDYAFYVGTNNKNYYLEYGLKEKQLIFAPHAIDNERFEDKSGNYKDLAANWRSEMNYKKSDKVFLFSGKFEKKKNPEILIEAAKELGKNNEIKFLFVGNGDLEQDLKQNTNSNIAFLPFQNQSVMPIIYHICDVFVLPSKGPGETWGLAVNEAMACKKAILVSDKVGCAVDLVEPGKNGFVFKSLNLNDLVSKIELLGRINLNKMHEASGEIIKNYSFEKSVKAIETGIYQLN